MQIFNLNNTIIHSTTLEEIALFLAKNLEFSKTPTLITTFNLDFLRIAAFDSEFFNICNNSLYNIPDGFGITSLVRLKYKKKISRITGNEIFLILLKLAKRNNLRVAIIGGSEYVSKAVEQKIYKEIQIKELNLLCLSPPVNFEQKRILNNEIIQRVFLFKPDIVFAALGCPRQEKWLYDNMNTFKSKINVGIGGTLDFYSGTKIRSPLLLQKIGLEWLWRLILEPRRLYKRYLLNDLPLFLKYVFFRKY